MTGLRLDLIGRQCPIPVIELARHITDVEIGDTITVVADDPAADPDIQAWCRMRGHDYLGRTPDGAATAYIVRRAR